MKFLPIWYHYCDNIYTLKIAISQSVQYFAEQGAHCIAARRQVLYCTASEEKSQQAHLF